MLKQKTKLRYSRAIVAGFLTIWILMTGNAAGALARSYVTRDQSIKTGMIVAVSGGTEGEIYVQKANKLNATLTVGVVTDITSTDISFANGQKGELLVADTGQVKAYVSDINGVPKKGDLLVPSPLNGFLMLSDNDTKGIIGALNGNFPGNASEYTLQDGSKTRIAIVEINMDIHPASAKGSQSAIQSLASRIVGHEVSETRLIAAAAALLLTMVVGGGVMYSAVANYIVSVGRNPLAKRALQRSFGSIMGFVILVFFLGVAASWMVLWL